MFRFTTAGESHGRALVAVLEGLPAGLPVDVEAIDRELARRQWGYGRGGRMKIERDRADVLSGVRHGLTLGSPVTFLIENKDWANWTDVMATGARDIPPEKSRRVKRPRPGHADLAGGQKFGARDLRNILERASARETAARVACGALAKQLLALLLSECGATSSNSSTCPTRRWSFRGINRRYSEDAPLRCADRAAQARMVALIDEKRRRAIRSAGSSRWSRAVSCRDWFRTLLGGKA